MKTGIIAFALTLPFALAAPPAQERVTPFLSAKPTIELMLPNADTDSYRLRVNFCDTDYRIWILIGDLVYMCTPCDQPLLAPDFVFDLGSSRACQFDADVPAWVMAIDSPIKLQCIVLTERQQFAIGDVIFLSDLVGDARRPGSTTCVDDAEISSERYAGPRMEAQLIREETDVQPRTGLLVTFTTPSNDYRAWHLCTDLSADRTRVFLILQEPGTGQGQLDIVEQHRVWVDLGDGQLGSVRVFVSRHKSDTDGPRSFELAAELEDDELR